jgi:hypothetical protein
MEAKIKIGQEQITAEIKACQEEKKSSQKNMEVQ